MLSRFNLFQYYKADNFHDNLGYFFVYKFVKVYVKAVARVEQRVAPCMDFYRKLGFEKF